jgi:16S rRNA processing protein RimM
MKAERDVIAIARIVRPRGLKGEVVANLLTDRPERFSELSRVKVEATDGTCVEHEVEDFWFHKSQVVLKFTACRTREDAERLRGAVIQVASDQLVKLSDGEYFQFQLLGCQVRTTEGAVIGHVERLIETGAAPLLVVIGDDGAEHLIPFAASICPDVDVAAKLIVIDPLDGLLDLNAH